ncbi:MAG: glycosyltransferase [Candidatus Nanosalina sp.]
MRIVFFSDCYFPLINGVNYTIKAWKERLEERGHDVFIVYPRNNHEPGEEEEPLPSIHNPFYPGYNVPVMTSYPDIPEPDIVHCHGPLTGLYGAMYARKHDAPSVYTHHTPLEEYMEQALRSRLLGDLAGRMYVPLEEKLLESFDTVTSSFNDIGRDVETVQLPVGIDLEYFHPVESSFVDDLGLERPVAGFNGRMSNEKNIETLVEFARDFDGSLLLIGEGPKRGELEEKAPDNVLFRDFIDRERLPGFYSGIDVFVTASTGDTLGISPLEANACGTPVVAPDTHPFDNTVEERNGVRYAPLDASDLREKVGEALQQDFSTREAVRKYSLEKTVDRLEDIYIELKS